MLFWDLQKEKKSPGNHSAGTQGFQQMEQQMQTLTSGKKQGAFEKLKKKKKKTYVLGLGRKEKETAGGDLR